MSTMSFEWVQENRKLTSPSDYGDIWADNTETFDHDFSRLGGHPMRMLTEMVENRRDYTVLSDFEHKVAVIDHYKRYLLSRGFDLGAALKTCQEVPFFSTELTLEMEGVQVSTDLLRKFCYLHEIKKFSGSSKKSPVFFEIGAGIGSLARVVRHFYPNCTYIISDLPESLYYSYNYLDTAYPGDVVLCSEDTLDSAVKNFAGKGGFILIPSWLKDKISGFNIDFLVNTASLGEMSNISCREWFEFIDKQDIEHLFLMNRYLNNFHLSPKRGNLSSLLLGPDWMIEEWVVDPEFIKSPLEEMEPNYLMLLTSKKPEAVEISNRDEAERHLKTAGVSNFINKHLELPDRFKGRIHRPIYSGYGGALYHYWQACRLWPSAQTFLPHLKFLQAWGPDESEFEEIFSYFYLLFTKDETTLKPLQESKAIWIYGAGAYGQLIFDIFGETNITIQGVFDSKTTGSWNGFRVQDGAKLASSIAPDDIVLITSNSWSEIAKDVIGIAGEATIATYGELFELTDIPRLKILNK